jgi:NAD(P)-dependent dehydrogenase (short-subunit alcohol dehydrogenase family)
MSEMRFDGRVAIVTGAGGNPSLGRSFARLLAERGAKVVVNDLGVGPDGRGVTKAHADLVAQEIVDAGGEAVADLNSVAEEASAQAVVQTALDAFGRVDVLVNNAGVCTLADFDELSSVDVQRTITVHLFGNVWMCRAVWPHFKEQGYGRIVNINSGAMFGAAPKVVVYGAAKGGIFGLTRGLALEGQTHGIRVNTLGPAAGTAAHQHLQLESEALTMMMEHLPPEQVAPAVAFLAHEDCPCTGRYLEAMGGRVYERVFFETQGYADPALTIEAVRDHWGQITSHDGMTPTPEPSPETIAAAAAFVPKPYEPV